MLQDYDINCKTVTILFYLLITQLTVYKRTITRFIADGKVVYQRVRREMRLDSDNSWTQHSLKHLSWRSRWIILCTLELRMAVSCEMHVALGSWQWIHQVAVGLSCKVTRGSGMTCHWIRPPNSSAVLEFYFWFRFRPYRRSRHVILHQSAKFYPNRTTLGRKKWRHVDFQDAGSPPSLILGVQ